MWAVDATPCRRGGGGVDTDQSPRPRLLEEFGLLYVSYCIEGTHFQQNVDELGMRADAETVTLDDRNRGGYFNARVAVTLRRLVFAAPARVLFFCLIWSWQQRRHCFLGVDLPRFGCANCVWRMNMKRLVVFIVVWTGLVVVVRQVLAAHLLSGGPFGAPIGHRNIGWSSPEIDVARMPA